MKTALAAGAFPFLPGCATFGRDKVRLACVGIGNRAAEVIRCFEKTGLVEFAALCDTDLEGEQCAGALGKYPNLPRFTDFRKMLDAMDGKIDAVAVCTPDFSHFPALMDAMRRGLAVFSEKPLAHTFEECELLMASERKHGVVTQMGNQGHSGANYYQFKHYVETGVIDVSKLTRLVAHMNSARRWHKWNGKVSAFPTGEALPKGLDWDTWLGTATYHAYSKDYVQGEWRSWYDFGNGALGDWGAHTMDCVHEFLLKGDLPTKVDLLKCEGWNQFAYPCATTLAFTFPKNALHDDVRLEWYDGADNWPQLPKGFVFDVPDGIPRNSANVEDDTSKKLYPGKEMYCKDGTVWQSLSHKHPLHRVGDFDAKLPDYPPETETHYRSFIRAVRGETRTTSPFSVSGRISQLFTLGCIAQRVRRSIVFDPAKGEIVGDEYANYFIKGPRPRKGWEGYYRI